MARPHRKYRGTHAACHKALRVGWDHPIVLGDETPGRFRFPSWRGDLVPKDSCCNRLLHGGQDACLIWIHILRKGCGKSLLTDPQEALIVRTNVRLPGSRRTCVEIADALSFVRGKRRYVHESDDVRRISSSFGYHGSAVRVADEDRGSRLSSEH